MEPRTDLSAVKYECGICLKEFTKSWMLQMHVLTHSSESLSCEECGQEFLEVSDLFTHMSQHIVVSESPEQHPDENSQAGATCQNVSGQSIDSNDGTSKPESVCTQEGQYEIFDLKVSVPKYQEMESENSGPDTDGSKDEKLSDTEADADPESEEKADSFNFSLRKSENLDVRDKLERAKGAYICKVCNFRFRPKERLRKIVSHVKRHFMTRNLEDTDDKFSEESPDGKEVESQSNQALQIPKDGRTDSESNEMIYKCDICSLDFSRLGQLQEHDSIYHQGQSEADNLIETNERDRGLDESCLTNEIFVDVSVSGPERDNFDSNATKIVVFSGSPSNSEPSQPSSQRGKRQKLEENKNKGYPTKSGGSQKESDFTIVREIHKESNEPTGETKEVSECLSEDTQASEYPWRRLSDRKKCPWFKCLKCNKKFQGRENVKSHSATCQCSDPIQGEKSVADSKTGKRRFHSLISKIKKLCVLKCKLCGRRFSSKRNMKDHASSCKKKTNKDSIGVPESQDSTCPDDEKDKSCHTAVVDVDLPQTKAVDKVLSGEIMSSRESNFIRFGAWKKCKICMKSMRGKEAVKSHYHPEMFESRFVKAGSCYRCTTCHKSLRGRRKMESHHHAAEPEVPVSKNKDTRDDNETSDEPVMNPWNKNYKCCRCLTCDKLLPSKAALRRHEAKHPKVGHHKCSLCGQVFKKKHSLRAHNYKHRKGKAKHGISEHNVLSEDACRTGGHDIVGKCDLGLDQEISLQDSFKTRNHNSEKNHDINPCSELMVEEEKGFVSGKSSLDTMNLTDIKNLSRSSPHSDCDDGINQESLDKHDPRDSHHLYEKHGKTNYVCRGWKLSAEMRVVSDLIPADSNSRESWNEISQLDTVEELPVLESAYEETVTSPDDGTFDLRTTPVLEPENRSSSNSHNYTNKPCHDDGLLKADVDRICDDRDCSNPWRLDPKQFIKQIGRQYVCSICCTKQRKRQKLVDHVMQHFEDRMFKCTICLHIFEGVGDLQEHVIDEHFSKSSNVSDNSEVTGGSETSCLNEYQCKVCDKQFGDMEKLKCHVEKHFAHKSFTCEVCGYSFKFLGSLQRHLFEKHSKSPDKTKRLKEICEKHFNKQGNLYRCDFCALELRSKETAKKHVRKHLMKQFSCSMSRSAEDVLSTDSCSQSKQLTLDFSVRQEMSQSESQSGANCKIASPQRLFDADLNAYISQGFNDGHSNPKSEVSLPEPSHRQEMNTHLSNCSLASEATDYSPHFEGSVKVPEASPGGFMVSRSTKSSCHQNCLSNGFGFKPVANSGVPEMREHSFYDCSGADYVRQKAALTTPDYGENLNAHKGINSEHLHEQYQDHNWHHQRNFHPFSTHCHMPRCCHLGMEHCPTYQHWPSVYCGSRHHSMNLQENLRPEGSRLGSENVSRCGNMGDHHYFPGQSTVSEPYRQHWRQENDLSVRVRSMSSVVPPNPLSRGGCYREPDHQAHCREIPSMQSFYDGNGCPGRMIPAHSSANPSADTRKETSGCHNTTSQFPVFRRPHDQQVFSPRRYDTFLALSDPVQCDTCGKLFYDKDEFAKHELTHKSLFKCPCCNSYFTEVRLLNAHILKTEHFACSCGGCFLSQDSLENHKKKCQDKYNMLQFL